MHLPKAALELTKQVLKVKALANLVKLEVASSFVRSSSPTKQIKPKTPNKEIGEFHPSLIGRVSMLVAKPEQVAK